MVSLLNLWVFPIEDLKLTPLEKAIGFVAARKPKWRKAAATLSVVSYSWKVSVLNGLSENQTKGLFIAVAEPIETRIETISRSFRSPK